MKEQVRTKDRYLQRGADDENNKGIESKREKEGEVKQLEKQQSTLAFTVKNRAIGVRTPRKTNHARKCRAERKRAGRYKGEADKEQEEPQTPWREIDSWRGMRN
eukprot:749189-Rhodomonas_salina.2